MYTSQTLIYNMASLIRHTVCDSVIWKHALADPRGIVIGAYQENLVTNSNLLHDF